MENFTPAPAFVLPKKILLDITLVTVVTSVILVFLIFLKNYFIFPKAASICLKSSSCEPLF